MEERWYITFKSDTENRKLASPMIAMDTINQWIGENPYLVLVLAVLLFGRSLDVVVAFWNLKYPYHSARMKYQRATISSKFSSPCCSLVKCEEEKEGEDDDSKSSIRISSLRDRPSNQMIFVSLMMAITFCAYCIYKAVAVTVNSQSIQGIFWYKLLCDSNVNSTISSFSTTEKYRYTVFSSCVSKKIENRRINC